MANEREKSEAEPESTQPAEAGNVNRLDDGGPISVAGSGGRSAKDDLPRSTGRTYIPRLRRGLNPHLDRANDPGRSDVV